MLTPIPGTVSATRVIVTTIVVSVIPWIVPVTVRRQRSIRIGVVWNISIAVAIRIIGAWHVLPGCPGIIPLHAVTIAIINLGVGVFYRRKRGENQHHDNQSVVNTSIHPDPFRSLFGSFHRSSLLIDK